MWEEPAVIANERQYRITKAQLKKMEAALQAFSLKEAAERTGSKVLAKAERAALESQVEELAEQILEFEALKSGAVRAFRAESLEELPSVLVKARIAKGLSQRGLAEILGLKEQQIQRYEAGNYASASLRRLAEVAEALQLEIRETAEVHTDFAEAETDEGEHGLDWTRFPIQEMYRRNWFEDFFSGSLAAARDNSEEVLREFVHRALRNPMPALLRRHVRAGSRMDTYALFAWQCRVLYLAKKRPIEQSFSVRAADKEWLRELVRKSRHDDGPTRTRGYLEASGIHLVIEPHLAHTYLDGAALLLPGEVPVVALTLRYDRLDNFWFVLVHELVHVVKHLRKGKTKVFFDDLDADPDGIEEEADQVANEVLIPADVWETALARYVRSEESVRELAKDLHISSAIIAGRIRKEAGDYTILADMVGQGEVRKQFPEVKYGQ